jgi:hypothetical protein
VRTRRHPRRGKGAVILRCEVKGRIGLRGYLAAEGGRREIEHRRGRERRSDVEGKGKIDSKSQMAVRIQEMARDGTQETGEEAQGYRRSPTACGRVDLHLRVLHIPTHFAHASATEKVSKSPHTSAARSARRTTTCHRYEHHFLKRLSTRD